MNAPQRVATPHLMAAAALPAWMRALREHVEGALERVLPAADTHPARLHAAMRYAVLGGGKRVRALLVYAAGEATGCAREGCDAAAMAVELIHAYSLVHDDLPCMDDDALRRGKPSVHVAFDEATALLVGDALQSLAFEVLCGQGELDRPVLQARLGDVAMLAAASGSRGMAGGQAIDLESMGAHLEWPALEAMHRAKTGALLRAAVLLGASSGRVPREPERAALERYAGAIGLAFQIVDDVLDVETTSAQLGKTAGKDAAHNKPTTVSLLGLVEAKARAEALRCEAHGALDVFGAAADRLRQLADFVVFRNH